MPSYTIAVDSLYVQSKKLVVFSGLTSRNRRVRVVCGGSVEPQIGEAYKVQGEWKYSEQYKKQLHADFVQRTSLSGRLLVPFLVSRIHGIGPEKATRLLDFFGDELGDILSFPDRVLEIAAALNQSGRVTEHSLILASFAQYGWEIQKTEFKTLSWLEANGVQVPASGRLVARILGDRAVEMLEQNPYILAGIASWKLVEEIGLPVLRTRGGKGSIYDAPERIVGAIDSVMKSVISDGHTAIDKDAFREKLRKRLQRPEATLDRALRIGLKYSALIDGGGSWRVPGCAFMEEDLVKRFRSMMSGGMFGIEKTAVNVSQGSGLKKALDRTTCSFGISLYPEQMAAAEKVLSKQLAVLRGGAGTGKTTVVRAIAETWKSMGGRVELAALAGKAALRMTEATLTYARTIHRLLLGVEDGSAAVDNQPVLNAKTLLIIDECGMVDLGLFHRIHQAMETGCRLLLVGDPAQLPPIGFGLVFHRLAEIESITATLTKIFRQSDASGIPVVARAIQEQRFPAFSNYSGAGEGVSFVEVGIGNLEGKVSQIAKDLGWFNDKHDLMICTATNDGTASVYNLNKHLGAMSHDGVETASVRGYLGQYFSVNDPVIYLRNNYSEGLYNGSLGWVKEVDATKRRVVATFGVGRNAEDKTIEDRDLIYLQLAYGLTCHKAQGSQAKRVIVPITNSSFIEPTWLYTAITRAEEQCVLVGEVNDLEAALKRTPAYMERNVGFYL